MRPIRAAIIGTGYIADFHARAIRAVRGVELVSVCDVDLGIAKRFAAEWGVPAAFDSLDSMLRNQQVNSVHVLAPPDHHHSLAKTALQSGAHVLLEKPMCTSVDEADDLLKLANVNKLRLGVNHNFLYAGAYQRLRDSVHSGALGSLDHITLNHFFELGQIRFGPFDAWMLRAPGNAILEIGPHLVSALLDLVGRPNALTATADRKVILPGGAQVFRRWRIHACVGRTAVDINIDLSAGFSQRTINIRGQNGSAMLDYNANTCAVDQRTRLSFDLDRYRRSRSLACQIQSQARATLNDYLLSTLKLRHRGNPYQVSILDSVGSFYSRLHDDAALDSRIDGGTGRDVVDWCNRIVHAADIAPINAVLRRRGKTVSAKPTVLVFGGTGFIGRELIRQLLAANYCVRAVAHRSSAVLEEIDSDHLEIVCGDIHSKASLRQLMASVDFVFHLARAEAKTWNDYLERDVEPTRLIAETCLQAGVKRLIYTGTIDSYYAGAKAGTITEQTSLDRSIARRNYYARAKATAETLLMDMHRANQLQVVIFRPGIVIGPHGSPFHWGVAMWISESLCEVWGEGKNKLPFVLVQDVAAALVRGIQVPGIEGRSYNLVDLPLLTARDYLDEMQRYTGMAIDVRYPAISRFYLTDLTKWVAKMLVRHPDRSRIPSYHDWESRTQKAIFDCTRARSELNWAPASDRQRIIDEGIGGSLKPLLEDSL